jgi:hypothetical protein
VFDDGRRGAGTDNDALRESRRQAEERGRGNKEKLLHGWVPFPKVIRGGDTADR